MQTAHLFFVRSLAPDDKTGECELFVLDAFVQSDLPHLCSPIDLLCGVYLQVPIRTLNIQHLIRHSQKIFVVETVNRYRITN